MRTASVLVRIAGVSPRTVSPAETAAAVPRHRIVYSGDVQCACCNEEPGARVVAGLPGRGGVEHLDPASNGAGCYIVTLTDPGGTASASAGATADRTAF